MKNTSKFDIYGKIERMNQWFYYRLSVTMASSLIIPQSLLPLKSQILLKILINFYHAYRMNVMKSPRDTCKPISLSHYITTN